MEVVSVSNLAYEYNVELLRLLVRTYYAIQKIRIQTGNRIHAMIYGNGNGNGNGHNGSSLSHHPGLVDTVHKQIDLRLKEIETGISKDIKTFIKGMPLWELYLKDVKGIGETFAAALIAEIVDIGRFRKVASLWKYFGLHVVNGKAPKKTKGQKIDWNPRCRTLAWKIGEAFIKIGDRGFYGRMYRKFKEEDAAKNPNLTKAHLRARAKRKTVKLFLAHLWQAWRMLEGKKIEVPYAVKHLGHKDFIPPQVDIKNKSSVAWCAKRKYCGDCPIAPYCTQKEG